MTPPDVPLSVWIWAGLDPLLIVAAMTFGSRADQPGKIFIAAIAGLGIALMAGAILGWLGIPWIAPVRADGPMLLPVRSVSALVWAAAGYFGRRALGGRFGSGETGPT